MITGQFAKRRQRRGTFVPSARAGSLLGGLLPEVGCSAFRPFVMASLYPAFTGASRTFTQAIGQNGRS